MEVGLYGGLWGGGGEGEIGGGGGGKPRGAGFIFNGGGGGYYFAGGGGGRFFSSLRWKIAFTYLLVIGIVFVVANISIIRIFEMREINEKQERFRAYAIQTAQSDLQ